MLVKKIVSFFIAFFLFINVSGLVLAQSPTPTPFPKTSYELFYPIVAGKVPTDQLYFLKLFKEWLAGKVLFDYINKSDFHLSLSKKRLVEAEKLIIDKKDTKLIKKTLEKAANEFQSAVKSAKTGEEKGKQTRDIYNTLKNDGNTISKFALSLSESSEGEVKEALNSLSNSIKASVDSI